MNLPVCIERCDGLRSVRVQRLCLLQQHAFHQPWNINVDVAAKVVQTGDVCLNPTQKVGGSGNVVSAWIITGHLYNHPKNIHVLGCRNVNWTNHCHISMHLNSSLLVYTYRYSSIIQDLHNMIAPMLSWISSNNIIYLHSVTPLAYAHTHTASPLPVLFFQSDSPIIQTHTNIPLIVFCL